MAVPEHFPITRLALDRNRQERVASEIVDHFVESVTKSTLYKLAQEGILPGSKVGKHWRFHKDTVVEWLKSHPEHGARPNSIDAGTKEDVHE